MGATLEARSGSEEQPSSSRRPAKPSTSRQAPSPLPRPRAAGSSKRRASQPFSDRFKKTDPTTSFQLGDPAALSPERNSRQISHDIATKASEPFVQPYSARETPWRWTSSQCRRGRGPASKAPSPGRRAGTRRSCLCLERRVPASRGSGRGEATRSLSVSREDGRFPPCSVAKQALAPSSREASSEKPFFLDREERSGSRIEN